MLVYGLKYNAWFQRISTMELEMEFKDVNWFNCFENHVQVVLNKNCFKFWTCYPRMFLKEIST